MSDKPVNSVSLGALSPWAPELAKTFVSLSSDIALVIDEAGVILDVAQGGVDPIAPGAQQWIGRAWIDTVSGDTRPKIENLLKEVGATGIARRREVNHPLGADASIPVAYTAIRLGENGPVLAVGRDLRTIAAIQKRYVDSQQDMERGYWQTRQADARYRLLLEVATDAMIVVNGETLHIVDANEAATELLNAPLVLLRGQHINSGFEHHSRGAVNELLGTARATGQSGEIRARLQGTRTSTSVVATPFRTDAEMRLLVRVRAIDADTASAARNESLSHLVDDARDGVVVTDSSGRVMAANPAFLKLAHLTSEAQLKGQPLARWVSLTDQPLAALVAKVRHDGMARHLESSVSRDAASAVPIEMAAVLLAEGDQECIGFTFRQVARAALPGAMVDSARGALDADSLSMALRAGIDTLSAQVGERDLTELMRDATALVEQHFLALTLRRSVGDVGTA